MKLHESLVEKLIQTYEVNAGWSEQWKLKAALKNLDFSVYTQQNGNQVLVATSDMAGHASAAYTNEPENREMRIKQMVEDAKKINEGK